MDIGFTVLLLLTAGGALQAPDMPLAARPVVMAQAVGQPAPASPPAAPRTPPSAPPAAPKEGSGTPGPPVAGEIATPATKAPGTALDLNGLEKRLKDTRAIGFFTKLTLKNQIDDLLDEFRDFYRGTAKRRTLTDLRQSYDLLMMKVLSLLQDEDRTLASDIVSSREAIWGLLADPTSFATLEV